MKNTILLTHLILCFSFVVNAFTSPTNGQIYFEENKGQVMDQNRNQRNDVLFYGQSGDLYFHVSNKGIHYQLIKEINHKNKTQTPDTSIFNFLVAEEDYNSKNIISEMYRVDILFENVNHQKFIINKKGQQNFSKNYYNTPKNTEPIEDVKLFETIVIENVYDNIDLKFYQNKEGLLEYDFIVKPGADYKDIKLKIEGADISINDNGILLLKTPFGEIGEGPLTVFQDNKILESKWLLEENHIRYHVENFDKNKTLIIDPPVRIWATYFGGTNFDEGTAVAVDNNNNVYLAGDTRSLNIATTGAHLTSFPGPSFMRSIYLAKLDENQNLLWATYYGDTGNDIVHGCEVDSDNNVIITGRTTSENNMTTTGAFQEVYAGGTFDAYIVKFDSSGTRLWATYFGGAGSDIPFGLAVDANDNIIIAGGTSSNTHITTPGAHQTNYGGASTDGFFAKFDPTGNRLWASYYGGVGTDEVVKCYSANNNIYLSGSSGSGNVLATPGTHQPNNAGGFDAFIAKFNENGQRQWGTYFGGTSPEGGRGVKFHNGNVYAVGSSSSTTGIASNNAFLTTFPGGIRTAYIAKFDDFGSLEWSTYFGGEERDELVAVDIDNFGNIIAVGETVSQSGIAQSNSLQNTLGGDQDGLIVSFNTLGDLNWSSYYGGSEREDGYDCVIDNNGDIYMVGSSRSANNISSAGALFPNLQGTSSGFIAKFDGFSAIINAPETACYGDSVSVNAGPIYADSFLWNDGSTSPSQNFEITHDTTITLIAFLGNRTDTISKTINVLNLPNVLASADDTILCSGESISLQASGADNYQWNGPLGFNTSNPNPQIGNSEINNTGYYYLVGTDTNLCTFVDSIFIEILESPTAQISANSPLCEGDLLSIVLTGSGDVSWTGPNNFTATDSLINIVDIALNEAGIYSFTLTANNNCSYADSVEVIVFENPQFSSLVVDEDGTCNGQIELQVLQGEAPFNFLWTGGLADTSFVDSLCVGNYEVEIIDANNCKSTDEIVVGTTVSQKINKQDRGIKIFPNPSQGFFTVNFGNYKNVNILIYDMIGKQIYQAENINTNKHLIDLQNSDNGIYWIEVYSHSERLYSEKLIKY